MAQGRRCRLEVLAQIVADLMLCGWYTQREIAQRNGVSVSTVNRIKGRYLAPPASPRSPELR